MTVQFITISKRLAEELGHPEKVNISVDYGSSPYEGNHKTVNVFHRNRRPSGIILFKNGYYWKNSTNIQGPFDTAQEAYENSPI